jgi:hypothetical protein
VGHGSIAFTPSTSDAANASLVALTRRGLDYPFPWPDLWQWYGHWSANLQGYASRRLYIRDLVTPTLDALERCCGRSSGGDGRPGEFEDASGWVT